MTGTELAVHGEDDRALDRLMARAKIIAKVPGLRKEIADKPEAVAGIMLSLEGYGLPTTIPGINNSFDWIDGQAVLSAHAYQALAARAGYQIIPVERSSERAVARVRHGNDEPVVVEYTIAEAKASRRLDEWVENWQTTKDGKKYAVRFVFRVDGEKVHEPWPEWVEKLIREQRVKRYEAWWSYRTDMLWKSAAKRAIKVACPHVLLGAESSDDVHEIPGAVSQRPQPDSELAHAVGDPAPGTPEDDVVDAELVDEPEEPQAGAEEEQEQWDPEDPSRPFE